MVRCQRLESQVLTLAKSVSQLSIDIQYNYTLNDQIQCLRHDMEMLRSQMVIIKQNIVQQSNNKLTQMNENHHNHHQQQQQQQPQQSNHLVNVHRFFCKLLTICILSIIIIIIIAFYI